jgi:hypothetical protein
MARINAPIITLGANNNDGFEFVQEHPNLNENVTRIVDQGNESSKRSKNIPFVKIVKGEKGGLC